MRNLTVEAKYWDRHSLYTTIDTMNFAVAAAKKTEN
jgi:hypothetical protein